MANESILKVVHQTARGLRDAGVMDQTTMRGFDLLCLPRVQDFTPAQIRRIRIRNRASQAVFAAYLNTSTSTVQKWEQGKKAPRGAALKLLELVDRKGIEVLV